MTHFGNRHISRTRAPLDDSVLVIARRQAREQFRFGLAFGFFVGASLTFLLFASFT